MPYYTTTAVHNFTRRPYSYSLCLSEMDYATPSPNVLSQVHAYHPPERATPEPPPLQVQFIVPENPKPLAPHVQLEEPFFPPATASISSTKISSIPVVSKSPAVRSKPLAFASSKAASVVFAFVSSFLRASFFEAASRNFFALPVMNITSFIYDCRKGFSSTEDFALGRTLLTACCNYTTATKDFAAPKILRWVCFSSQPL